MKKISKSWLQKETQGIFKFEDADLELLRTFVFQQWAARAHERGMDMPDDLSSSCKFCSLFMKVLYGGKIQGNYDHQYNVIDGNIVDLSENSMDVVAMDKPYRHDPVFFGNFEHIDSLESCLPRVTFWVEDFKREMGTWLLIAADAGNISKVKALIEKGVNIDYVNDRIVPNGASGIEIGHSALLLAIKRKDKEMVDMLIGHGADINRQESVVCAPLAMAARLYYYEIAEKLLRSGANPNVNSFAGYETILHGKFQAYNKRSGTAENTAMIKLLISYDADMLIKDHIGQTFLDKLDYDLPGFNEYKDELISFINAHQENKLLNDSIAQTNYSSAAVAF